MIMSFSWYIQLVNFRLSGPPGDVSVTGTG